MEIGELHAIVGPRRVQGICALLLRWYDSEGQLHEERREIMLVSQDPRVGDDLSIAPLVDMFASLARELPAAANAHRLLLTVQAEDLYGLDWERLLVGPGWPWPRLLRYRDASDRRLFEVAEHPPRVLWVDSANSSQQPLVPALARYFRVHRLSGLSAIEFDRTLADGVYEIVQLLLEPQWSETGKTDHGVLTRSRSAAGAPIDSVALQRLLVRSRTRLLILSPANLSALAPARDLAHRLQLRAGPTTVVRLDDGQADWQQRYLDLVHDAPIDGAMLGWGDVLQTASLFSSISGSEVLRIRPRAEALSRNVEWQLAAAQQIAAKTVGAEVRPPKSRRSRRARQGATATDLISRLVAKQPRVWNYARETGAWEPLPGDEAEYEHDARELLELQQGTQRVLNVGLERDDHGALGPRDVLPPSSSCTLTVQVGLATGWSLLRKTVAIAEQALAGHYGPRGVTLRVVVFAPDFELADGELELLLPPPPLPSEVLRIALRAPAKSGRHRVRVGLYHENNLLQSVLLRLHVLLEGPGKPRGDLLQAEVEFALSATLDEEKPLPPRTLNILSNAADDGSHTLAIVANGVKKQFDIGEAKMQGAVRAARASLDAIAADRTSGKPVYRFDANNAASLARFEKDLVQLADFGAELFLGIVVAKDRAFEDQLLKTLGARDAAIQVAVTASADYVFPWALVYDHAHLGRTQRMCPDFRRDWNTPRFDFSKQRCLRTGCAHRDDGSIVCPSGFWGFKHHVEQPSPVSVDAAPGSNKIIVTELPGARQRAAALMAVSRKLDQVSQHEAELKRGNAFTYEVEDTVAEAWQRMRSAADNRLRLVYFYCHGGRDDARVWLSLGSSADERLTPGDLRQIQWAGLNPLVLINGCHTVDIKPDDLLHFTRMFARCDAAGVVGTEISIPEELARDFACGFLERFAAGTPVGDAVRSQRLSLLARGNLLGLAYTPYCSNSLHMV